MKKRMGRAALAIAVMLGCAGCDSGTETGSPYAGEWTGTWVAVGDPSDTGTSEWTIDEDGDVDGTDADPGRSTSFQVTGHITERGELTTTSVPADGSPTASLDGMLGFDADRRLTGILVWGVVPPLSYRYTFTRR